MVEGSQGGLPERSAVRQLWYQLAEVWRAQRETDAGGERPAEARQDGQAGRYTVECTERETSTGASPSSMYFISAILIPAITDDLAESHATRRRSRGATDTMYGLSQAGATQQGSQVPQMPFPRACWRVRRWA